jgi:outer membrane cobalamin receptor
MRTTKIYACRPAIFRVCGLLGGFVLTGAMFQPQSARAADDPQPQADSGHLEKITVTARKREENVKDVPATITVLTSQTLERYDMSDQKASRCRRSRGGISIPAWIAVVLTAHCRI